MRIEALRDKYYLNQNAANNYLDPFLLRGILSPTYEASKDFFRVNTQQKIGGYSAREFTSADQLYDLMPQNDYQQNIRFSGSVLKFRHQEQNKTFQPLQFQIEIVFKIKGKGGKTYFIKRKTLDNGVSEKGDVTHTVAYWEDVSFLKPSRLYAWKVLGKNAEFFDMDIPEVSSFQGTLSNREIEILRLLARGFHSRDIASALKLSRHTVDTHRRNMLRKMEVANTPELLLMAKDMGLY